MRQILTFLCLLLCTVTSSFSAEISGDQTQVKDYLAILDLETVGLVNPSLSKPLSDCVRHEIVRSGRYKVLERVKMHEILKEQAFQMSGCVDSSCAVKAGQLLGVGKIIIGSLGLVGRTYYLSLSQVDVETGKTEAIEEDICKCEPDELIASAKRVARKLMGEKVVEGPKPPEPPGVEPRKPAEPRSPSEKTYKDPTTGMEFVLIPSGRFTMGSPSSEPDRRSDEGPQHEVTLSRPFYMGKYEVTQAQWQAVMGNNPSGFQGCDQCPVERVSWNDMQEFIQMLNERAGMTGYRLPTEAEWEYACRAGSQGVYSFGDDAGSLEWYAWHGGNSSGKTHPVGRKRANAWGLYDLHGNVWEWCQDWYGPYAPGALTDPTGPSSGPYRVFRGGSWLNDPWALRCSHRNGFVPSDRNAAILGFRLAFSPQQ